MSKIKFFELNSDNAQQLSEQEISKVRGGETQTPNPTRSPNPEGGDFVPFDIPVQPDRLPRENETLPPPSKPEPPIQVIPSRDFGVPIQDDRNNTRLCNAGGCPITNPAPRN